MEVAANMRLELGRYTVGAEEMTVIVYRETDGMITWRPADVFTVGGIRYRSRGDVYLQPMLSVKRISYTEWDGPHVSKNQMFQYSRLSCPEWADLEWDPDLTF